MKHILLLLMPIIIFAACVKDRTQPTVAPVVVPTGDTLMYFWSFYAEDSADRSPDFAVNAGATFSYWANYIDYTTGTSIDSVHGFDTAYCLRVRNPADSVVFYMPTTGYDSIILEYAEEATSSGASSNGIYYTVDGVHFVSTAFANPLYTVQQVFTANTFDFSSDPLTNDNPKFAVAIVFNNVATATSGNDRIANFQLRGVRK